MLKCYHNFEAHTKLAPELGISLEKESGNSAIMKEIQGGGVMTEEGFGSDRLPKMDKSSSK